MDGFIKLCMSLQNARTFEHTWKGVIDRDRFYPIFTYLYYH
jgi:hypothetical protein